MATEKEKALVAELVGLTLEIGQQGEFDATVDVRAAGVEFRIHRLPWSDEWTYYGDNTAYFSNDVFDEKYFEKHMKTFIAEAKKHHKAFDADGVKL